MLRETPVLEVPEELLRETPVELLEPLLRELDLVLPERTWPPLLLEELLRETLVPELRVLLELEPLLRELPEEPELRVVELPPLERVEPPLVERVWATISGATSIETANIREVAQVNNLLIASVFLGLMYCSCYWAIHNPCQTTEARRCAGGTPGRLNDTKIWRKGLPRREFRAPRGPPPYAGPRQAPDR